MRGEYSMQPRGVDHDDVIEALASDRADDAFRVGVLPRRSRRRSHSLHVHQRWWLPRPQRPNHDRGGDIAVRHAPKRHCACCAVQAAVGCSVTAT